MKKIPFHVQKSAQHALAWSAASDAASASRSLVQQLYDEFGERFSQAFRTITTDNDSELSAFSAMKQYGAQVYFAHPYSSWARSVNERSNRILRRSMPKGKSMSNYTDDQVLIFSDETNAMLRNDWDITHLKSFLENISTRFARFNHLSALFRGSVQFVVAIFEITFSQQYSIQITSNPPFSFYSLLRESSRFQQLFQLFYRP